MCKKITARDRFLFVGLKLGIAGWIGRKITYTKLGIRGHKMYTQKAARMNWYKHERLRVSKSVQRDITKQYMIS